MVVTRITMAISIMGGWGGGVSLALQFTERSSVFTFQHKHTLWLFCVCVCETSPSHLIITTDWALQNNYVSVRLI